MDKNKTGIFVDFDECLIHGFRVAHKSTTYDKAKQKFETASIADGKSTYAIVLRPGAKEFLKSLQKITPNIFILTAGLKQFQTSVALEIGLMGLVKGLYGRDCTDVPTFPFCVLIDDMSIKSPNTFRKCQQMGIIHTDIIEKINYGTWNTEDEETVVDTIKRHFIPIERFTAQNSLDNGFATTFPLIKPTLEKQKNDSLRGKIAHVFENQKISNI